MGKRSMHVAEEESTLSGSCCWSSNGRVMVFESQKSQLWGDISGGSGYEETASVVFENVLSRPLLLIVKEGDERVVERERGRPAKIF